MGQPSQSQNYGVSCHGELIKNNPRKNHPGNTTPKEITLKNFIPEKHPGKYHNGKVSPRKNQLAAKNHPKGEKNARYVGKISPRKNDTGKNHTVGGKKNSRKNTVAICFRGDFFRSITCNPTQANTPRRNHSK